MRCGTCCSPALHWSLLAEPDPVMYVPPKLSAMERTAAVGDLRPQPSPNALPAVSCLAAAWNWSHVHGLSAVGTATPALSSSDLFANTTYDCNNVGAP